MLDISVKISNELRLPQSADQDKQLKFSSTLHDSQYFTDTSPAAHRSLPEASWYFFVTCSPRNDFIRLS